MWLSPEAYCIEGEKEGAADRISVDTSLAVKLQKKENLILLKLTFILKQMPFLALFFHSSKIKVLTKVDWLLNISTSAHGWTFQIHNEVLQSDLVLHIKEAISEYKYLNQLYLNERQR